MIKMDKAEMLILKIGIWVALIVMALYAPFELTRLLVLFHVNGVISFYLPWYWVYEVVALWAGYIILGGIALYLHKQLKLLEKQRG